MTFMSVFFLLIIEPWDVLDGFKEGQYRQINYLRKQYPKLKVSQTEISLKCEILRST